MSTGGRPLTPPRAGLLHSPARQRRGERREGEGAVPVDLDELAAGAEEQHGAELRVYAAPDNDLVPLQAHHRLDGGAGEVLRREVLANGPLHLLVGTSHLFCVHQVQAHPADVRLVGYGVRVELEDYRVAEVFGEPDGFLSAAGYLRLYGRDAVG
jgi:hypothetical protein